jgi:hypothetical protein
MLYPQRDDNIINNMAYDDIFIAEVAAASPLHVLYVSIERTEIWPELARSIKGWMSDKTFFVSE